jgi:anti-sigma factor RsiW
MDCRTARMLMPFARPTGELPAEEQALVEQHLAECPECRVVLRHEQQFDAAVARAMRSVEVPAGLRDQIGVRLAQQRGRTIHRRAWQVVALAASVLLILSFSLGWYASRTTINADQLVQASDVQFVYEFNRSRESAADFFAARKVRVELPTDLDYGLLARLDVVEFSGKDVARLEFQSGQNRLQVYVLPSREFRLAKNASTSSVGSYCTIEVNDSPRHDYLFVFVYYGEANRQLFVPHGVVG